MGRVLPYYLMMALRSNCYINDCWASGKFLDYMRWTTMHALWVINCIMCFSSTFLCWYCRVSFFAGEGGVVWIVETMGGIINRNDLMSCEGWRKE